MGANQSAKGMAGKPFDEEVSEVTTALEVMAKGYVLEAKSLSGDLAVAMLDQYKHRPKPWSAMTAEEQADLVAAVNAVSETLIGKVVVAIATEDRPTVRGKVMSFNDTGDKAKLVLEIQDATPADMMDIHAVMRKDVVVVLADSRDFIAPAGTNLIEPDQPEMGFDAETQSGEAGDDSLAGQAGEDSLAGGAGD